MDHSDTHFLVGHAAFADLLFFAKAEDKSTPATVSSIFFWWDNNAWGESDQNAPWPAASMASIKPADGGRVILAIGPHGDYWEYVPQAKTEVFGKISKDSFLSRRLRVIEETVFAAGMARKMFRRERDGSWTPVGPKVALPEGKAAGFNDLAGRSLKEIYAVGWHGEIWRWNGKTWRQIDSPLSAHLSAACCLPDGTVIAVGYDGAMVQGKGDEWRTIDTGRKETLLSVAHFRGETYVCSAYLLMHLTPDGLKPVENLADPDDEPATCLHLLPSDDGEALFLLGPKDLFLLTDSWARIV
jgi:hypothetical protein